MKLCCCISLQKGVVAIGVISLLSSAVLVVMNMVMSVTFEEHVSACRRNVSSHPGMMTGFPSCERLTNAPVLIACRIFIHIKVLVCIMEIITSALLIVAALKKRTNLLIPWVIVSILAVLILARNIYEAARDNELTTLLLLIASLLIVLYFLVVVRSFSVHTIRAARSGCFPSHDHHHVCHRSSSVQTLPTCFEYSKPSAAEPGKVDLPPAYTPFTSSKKGPLPKGLGVRY